MLMLDIKAIRARADAATPGPWFILVSDVLGHSGHKMAVCQLNHRTIIPKRGTGIYVLGEDRIKNIVFVANARTDIPLLCDRVEALEAEVARVKSDRQYIIGFNSGFDDAWAQRSTEITKLEAEVKALRTVAEIASVHVADGSDDPLRRALDLAEAARGDE